MPSAIPPVASRTALTGTPVKITQPAAPTVHCVPLGLCSEKPLPLPEHCNTMVTEASPSDLSSATVKLRGDLTPLTSSFQASGFFMMSSDGGAILLRTYSLSSGVMPLEPKALRRVSMVLALWTIMLSASFHLAYGGRGLALDTGPGADLAAGSLESARAKPPPRPAQATAPLAVISMRRRVMFVDVFIKVLLFLADSGK